MKKKVLIFSVCLIPVVLSILYFKTPQKSYNLSIAAIMKNERPYLKEWLEYHLLQGVDHFYLCDNESTDKTKEYLSPYIKNNTITYIYMPGNNKQRTCYEKIVREHKDETSWLAFLDIDEYLTPLKAENFKTFLKEFEDVSEVSLNWMNYGDSNAVNRKNGLITEFFTSHGRFLNHTVKSVVRPEKIIDFNSFGSNHYVKVKGKSVNEYHKPVQFMLNFNISGDKARINHYLLKTFSEFQYKQKRGHPEGTPIDYAYYFFHNDNEIKNDTSMQRFLPALKARMKKSPLKDVAVPQNDNLPENREEILFSPDEVKQILGYLPSHRLNLKELEYIYKNRRPQYKK